MFYSNNADLVHLFFVVLGFSVSLICGVLFLRR